MRDIGLTDVAPYGYNVPNIIVPDNRVYSKDKAFDGNPDGKHENSDVP